MSKVSEEQMELWYQQILPVIESGEAPPYIIQMACDIAHRKINNNTATRRDITMLKLHDPRKLQMELPLA